MLVLSRRRGERIVICPDVEIEIVEIYRDSVKVGVVAPKEVQVYRKELIEADAARRRAAEDGRDAV